MKRHISWLAGVVCLLAVTAERTAGYTPVTWGPGLVPGIGPGVIAPELVFGKEYSHDLDQDSVGNLLPEQVIAWDGLGGVLDGLNYEASRGGQFPRMEQVDALANHGDALYTRLFNPTTRTFPDQAHLVFSIDDTVHAYAGGFVAPPNLLPPVPGAYVPPTGPVTLSNGNTIGGSGDISVELAGAFVGPEVQTLWTDAPRINATAPPRDVDGLELWGPEPVGGNPLGDANKYSLDIDSFGGGGISVWSYDVPTHTSVPYITHATIVAAVEALLGPVPGSAFLFVGDTVLEGREGINLDALMVLDTVGSTDSFDARTDPDGVVGNPPHDSIIFSIRQMVDLQDPSGYYATGSELFVLDASGYVDFLRHGGHAWDKSYALSELQIVTPNGDLAIIDINAIEAIGEVVVPEPSSFALMLLGLLAATRFVRQRR